MQLMVNKQLNFHCYVLNGDELMFEVVELHAHESTNIVE